MIAKSPSVVCEMPAKRSIEEIAYLKARLLADGVRLADPTTMNDVRRPFYSVVTQGVELDLLNGVTANVQINAASGIALYQGDKHFELSVDGERYPLQLLPVSSMLSQVVPGTSRPVSDFCYIATDRINIWALESCAMAVQNTPCQFCDVAFDGMPYNLQGIDEIRHATKALITDVALPPRHVQVSGGTPQHADWKHFLSVCEVAVQTGLPVSVMATPWTPMTVLESLRHMGVTELALNMEFSSETARRTLTPGKMECSLNHLAKVAERWSEGAVRSALIVGPEPEHKTIEGVHKLLERGIIPMLSPFRPAPGTPMAGKNSPTAEMLYSVFMRSLAAALNSGSFIGPTCRHCQHNVMALPLNLLD